MSVILADVGDTKTISIRWYGLGTASIASVTYLLPSPLSYSNAEIQNEATPPYTNLTVAGAEHGQSYMCEAQVVLSTGEVLNRQFVIKGINN